MSPPPWYGGIGFNHFSYIQDTALFREVRYLDRKRHEVYARPPARLITNMLEYSVLRASITWEYTFSCASCNDLFHRLRVRGGWRIQQDRYQFNGIHQAAFYSFISKCPLLMMGIHFRLAYVLQRICQGNNIGMVFHRWDDDGVSFLINSFP